MTIVKSCFCFILICMFFSCSDDQVSHPNLEILTLDFEGPSTSENDDVNPFTDYRLTVTFKRDNEEKIIQGFYAADGNAAETSATAGNIWRVNFVPNKLGDWTWEASFRSGKNIVINENPDEGEGVFFDGEKENFWVYNNEVNKRRQGRLKYVGKRYLQFEESGKYFLKAGPNSPENFLAYQEFDGTYASDTSKNFIKTYESHIQDWNKDDPTWQGGKGKGIIGALNYISEKGMNTVYFLTMNIAGDGRDVWPYISHNDFTRFDCSKLDQWNIVFDHAQKLGIMLHFVLQETENELLLDKGNTELLRKLYFRELVARFGHHHKLTWNLGEKNGYAEFTPTAQNDKQRKAMATYLKSIDAYNNCVVIHTHSWPEARDPIVDPLLGFQHLDGLSLQIDKREMVHSETLKYIAKSEKAGRTWVSSMDEIGMYWMGAMPDVLDPQHDTLRQEVLWGHLMAGGPGVEWYFGYKYPPADLDCEDWRSRENLWTQSKVALDFFNQHLPFWKMNNADELIDDSEAYCFAQVGELYVIYLKKPSNVKLKIEEEGEYSIQWFDPKKGGDLQNGTIEKVKGEGWLDLRKPQNDWTYDRVALVKRK